MTKSIILSKYQGFKTVDFGELYGELKVRPLGSNESLELSKITRKSIKTINELLALQAEINAIDPEMLKDNDSNALEKIERGEKLLAQREKMATREFEIYSGCFEDRKKGAEVLSGLSSMAMQNMFNEIFSGSDD